MSPEADVRESTLMLREAGEGGDAVTRFLSANADAIGALAMHLRTHPPAAVVTCARGSSDHAATYAKYMIETFLGIPTSSAALSVASIFDAPVSGGGNLCIAISQSGRSPDLLATVEAQHVAGATVIALVNDETSPLAGMADHVLPLSAGPERSVAATKSYITALAGIAALVAAWSDDADLRGGLQALPAQLKQAFAIDWSTALPIFEADRSLFVIGRGYGLAIAQEAALKMKETCGLHAEAFSSAEVRHGPMTIVGPGFPVLAFATSDEAGDDVRSIVSQFAERGASTALVAAHDGTLAALDAHPALQPVLMIQSFYRFANALSLARGMNPDLPPHLNKVTSTR
ncbi:glutamine--fructose-6-phosphate transaminase [Sphingomonas gellani]|uniref:Glutamine--fructose-6-phosphate transaminase n=1 Tax=Sphingomonas gellani TaxID=1166340 RepID=A0A1H8AZL3_9SPHN|nr:SIS domain-containing protein [Sphingomonas gellani]SEM75238.1 glutamine--fructose-6-phosphate transaminase [Sphingomonas gellani]